MWSVRLQKKLCKTVLSLPMHPYINDEVSEIYHAIAKFMTNE